MRPILLIAGNYMREQRWTILLLLLWVGVSSIALGIGNSSFDDSLFFLRQQAVYGVAFGGFLASSALSHERRSRRILSVLSKGVERWQYLMGLLLGIAAIELVYALAMTVGGEWTLRQSGEGRILLGWLIPALLVAALSAMAAVLFFSTFLSPLLALAAAALANAIPAAIAAAFGKPALSAAPAYRLLVFVLSAEPTSANHLDGWLFVFPLLEAAAFLLAATLIFSRRDIAATIE
jgi:ABC-type transport system involved in multi-copper enzyme maturation permease subunit